MKAQIVVKYGRRLIVTDEGRVFRAEHIDSRGRRWKVKELCTTPSKGEKYARIKIGVNGGQRTILAHRLVAETFLPNYSKHLDVDHIDGDGNNNSVKNLRILTRSENCRAYCKNREGSSSKFRGVTWCKATKRWLAQCWDGVRNHNLGRYDEEKEAARAYNRFAKSHGFFPEALNQINL